jgi:hypothetical protein
MAPRFARRWWPTLDVLGTLLSLLCALHCLAMPLLLLALPFMAEHGFERGLLTAIGGVALVAIGGGVLVHRRFVALAPFLVGFAALVVAQLLGAHTSSGLLFSLAASLLLVTAHWLNARTCRAACEPNAA